MQHVNKDEGADGTHRAAMSNAHSQWGQRKVKYSIIYNCNVSDNLVVWDLGRRRGRGEQY